jgi:mannose-1-phosphate guanylyltransferase/mannose-6-phosphate isomerase
MIQATAERLEGMASVAAPVVVCGERHVEAISEQLAEIADPPRVLVAEPVGRNTAPAIALAAELVEPDSVLLVLPADHVVADVAAFRDTVQAVLPAVQAGSLVTFGVVPTSAETGYGYIRMGRGSGPVRPVKAFVEKPRREVAEAYVSSGEYVWNSGMFAFRADAVLEELERYEPDILVPVRAALEGRERSGVVRPGMEFAHAPSISFDYAVMERTDQAVVAPLDAGWSDVGSWATLWELDEKDDAGNVIKGDAVVVDAVRSYVRADSRLVAVVGLADVVVVDTGDAVLVAARDRVQDVKEVVERLRGRSEIDVHPE